MRIMLFLCSVVCVRRKRKNHRRASTIIQHLVTLKLFSVGFTFEIPEVIILLELGFDRNNLIETHNQRQFNHEIIMSISIL